MTGRRAEHQRRARRVLGWAVLWVVLVQLAVGLLLGSGGWQVRFPEMARTLDAWRPLDPPPDVVAVGSSRTGCALNDGLVNRFLNDGRPGRRVQFLNASISAGDFHVMDRLLTRAEEERLPLPRILVVEANPDLLAGARF